MVTAILDSGLSEDIKNYRNYINYVSENKESKWDNYGHGTMCYNIIKSINNTCVIDVIKVLDKFGCCDVSILCTALHDLIYSDVDIINLSLSVLGYLDEINYEKLFNICEILYNKNKIIICAAKNYYSGKAVPASFKNVLGVCGGCTENENIYCYNPLLEYQIKASNIPVLTNCHKAGCITFFKGNSKATALISGIMSKTGTINFFKNKKDINFLPTEKFIYNYLLNIGKKDLFVEYKEEFYDLKKIIISLNILEHFNRDDFFYKEKICFDINKSNVYFKIIKELERTYNCKYLYESIRLIDFSNIYSLFWGIKKLWKKMI